MNTSGPNTQIDSHSPGFSRSDYRRARLARDARFDGLFFIAVKTTGIFCRPICPANSPAETNVEYFEHATQAATAGYRPCLRCRPDSAPGSCAWRGTDTTFTRALGLIDSGALQNSDLATLAPRLGISDRYLRRLFQERLGLSPKAYALYSQVMFAKKLLHETGLSIGDIAAAAGFNSMRRFNDAFVKQLQLTPSAIRRNRPTTHELNLSLSYRPPLNWQTMLDFWTKRSLKGIEWVDGNSYGRTFSLGDPTKSATGYFTVAPGAADHTLSLSVTIDQPSMLRPLVVRIRQILDLDADINLIERQLAEVPGFSAVMTSGLRIPGIWHPFEAGVRAILGQQVSVAAARTHLNRLVEALGKTLNEPFNETLNEPLNETLNKTLSETRLLFPTPKAVASSDLAMLKMPNSRRETLRRFAQWYAEQGETAPFEDCLALKGIGPWTVDYVRMRALGNTDIWLAGDLGIKKALLQISPDFIFDSDQLKPWRSYATFHLWNYLS